MSLNIPNAPNAGLFKGGYNKSVLFLFLLLRRRRPSSPRP